MKTTSTQPVPWQYPWACLAAFLIAAGFAYPHFADVAGTFSYYPFLLTQALKFTVIFGLLVTAVFFIHRWAMDREPDSQSAKAIVKMTVFLFAIATLTIFDLARTFVIKELLFRLLLVGLITWFVLDRKRITLPPRSIFIAMVVYLAILLIAAVTGTHPTISYHWVLDQLLCIGFYLFIFNCCSGNRCDRFFPVSFLPLALSINACYVFIQVLGIDPFEWAGNPTIGAAGKIMNQAGGCFGNPNFSGNFSLLGFIFAVTTFSLVSSRRAKFIFGFAAGLNLLALFLSFSRAAWVTAIVAAAVWLLFSLRRFRLRTLAKRYLWVFITIGVIGLLFAGIFHEMLWFRLASFVAGHRSFVARVYLFQAALEMAKSKPLFGWGPNNYQFIYDQYIDNRYFLLYPPSGDYILHAHNEYLQLLAETGLLGLCSWLALLLLIIKNSSTRSGGTSDSNTAIRHSIYFALGVILFHSLFSLTLRHLFFQAMLWLLLALLTRQPRKTESDKINSATPPAADWHWAVIAVIVGGVFFLFAQPYLGHTLETMGGYLVAQHKAEDAKTVLRQALRLFPGNIFVMNNLAYTYSITGHLDETSEMLGQLREYSHSFGNPAFKFAMVAYAKHDYPAAYREFLAAKAIEPSGDVLFYAAEVELALRKYPEAIADMQQARVRNPRLADNPDWNFLMARIHYHQADFERAKGFLARAAQQAPGRPEFRHLYQLITDNDQP